MKIQTFLRSNCQIIIIAVSCIAVSCVKVACVPWFLNTPQLWEDYNAAVADARTAELDEICHTLPSITVEGDNPKIEWISENGKSLVLVGSMISAGDTAIWRNIDSVLPGESLVWVTLPYDLEDHLRNSPICKDSLECRMRLIQLLGLPPDCEYDRMVFFYAESARLIRPSADPEIDDCEASLDFSANAPEHYRKWFAENSAFSYESDTPYPWTRLGYTYDWNRGAQSEVGPAEFVVHPAAQVRIKREVTVWKWYQEIVR